MELGCGNGRDGFYFASIGVNVTGVDASDGVICKLQKYNKSGNPYFVCDDFVHFLVMSVEKYDYCYSRFSLHAINEEQEDDVIQNAYRVLKENGKFFIEVRSIHDDIYGKGEKVGRNAFYYNGHFRRFLVKEELEKKLTEVGFIIEYLEENIDFAPFGDENPLVIRCIASKRDYEKGKII